MSLVGSVMAQDADKTQKIEVTGSLIRRTDKATPSVVQSYSREDIRNSGYGTIENLLRANSAVDTGSVGDGAASGFVAGLSTISLRGLGSQSTLVLINGRRIAPVGAVDINFGRGSLISVNTIPKSAVERVDILKDGASALYGSDAIAGVVNYILRKDYEGIEGGATYESNDRGVGVTKGVNLSFGFGNLESQSFNIFGGIAIDKRDQVLYADIKDRGSLSEYNNYLNSFGNLSRFTPTSSASLYGNYYKVPASLTGSTVINGITVANSNLAGANYLGTFPGCPDDRTVGKGVPNRPAGFLATTPTLPTGYCRFDTDSYAEAIAAQDRFSGSVRGTYVFNANLTGTADLMYSRTKTKSRGTPTALTTTLATTANPVAVTWPTLTGFSSQNALILPVGHPDNPTNGTANAQPIQLIYRFEDLPTGDISTLEATRATMGLEGTLGAWDFDAALMYSLQDNNRTLQARLRKSLLNASIASGTYRFGRYNTPAAIASISSDAVNIGKSSISSIDAHASRELFALPGGKAALALGGEARRESLSSAADDNYLSGDYVGLVGNATKGSRNVTAAFTELSLPVIKSMELQAAARFEKYSDFGKSTTGKLGFKFTALPSELVFRGTAATGFRAPSISQISDSFALSFNNSQERRVFDNLRCNIPKLVSNAAVDVPRDCNVLNFTAVGAATLPGNVPTRVSANKDLKPERSRSVTLGLVWEPIKEFDIQLDAWYFDREDEIRTQRTIDLMDAYNNGNNFSGVTDAATLANSGPIVRDPNPATWLPGIANSGPIILLVRQYGNYKYTRTSGIDYDVNLRLPEFGYGKVSFKLQGTYTNRYDQLILAGTAPARIVGTATSDIPRTRASLTLNWKTENWASYWRFNHADPENTSTSDSCNAATSGPNLILQAMHRCRVGRTSTTDVGVTYTGIKALTLTAAVFNLTNDYGRSNGIPSAFTYWDQGLTASLGRRFNFSASYQFK